MKAQIGRLIIGYVLLLILVVGVVAIVMVFALPKILQDIIYILTVSIILWFGIRWALQALR